MSTPEKQFLLLKMQQEANAAHQEAEKKAQRAGKPPPPPPPPLSIESLEFPKWLHKGWKETDKAPGHYAAAESKLVHNAEELKAALAKGFTEAAPKAVPAKE